MKRIGEMDILQTVLKETNMELFYKGNIEHCKECGEPTGRVLEHEKQRFIVPRTCRCVRERREREKIINELKEKEERINRVQGINFIDSHLRSHNFKNWDHSRQNRIVFEMAKKYVDEFEYMKSKSMGLFIYGSPSSGKTFTACSISNELRSRYIPVIFTQFIDLLDRIKATFDSDTGIDEYAIIRSLDSSSLLVIDDLGKERITDWSMSKLYQIVDNRIRKKLPLIITSNFTPDEIKDKYGVAIYERIIYQACIPSKISSSSMREKEAEEKMNLFFSVINSKFEK